MRSDNGEPHAADVAMMAMMELDRDACYRALRARDARFDGRFFIAVRTTGIYCRPICPARCPELANIVFYPSAAAAQEAGYRPCLRCRPECSPRLAAWRGTANTVSRALALIAGGALDGERRDVGELASRLGLGERQLRRLFRRHLGASPVAVAQTKRVLFAKQLLHETRMRMIDVSLAAGFGSVRRFNAMFQRLYGRPPSALRRKRFNAAMAPSHAGSAITLTLSYAPPYDWPAMIGFLAARAIPGIEVVESHRYLRSIDLGGSHGTLEVAPLAGRDALAATIRFAGVRPLPAIVERVRRVFDLGADVETITQQLAEDPRLAPLVAARPGLRVPGAWDGFELAVRAILGQQITVAGARRLAGRLVAAHGEPLACGGAPGAAGELGASGKSGKSGLTAVFPRPARLAATGTTALASLGMPRARAAALVALARMAAADPHLFDPDASLDTAVARLRSLPGIGAWTAHYIAMRALREPDAFPAADVGLLRAMAGADGVRPNPAALLARAEAWRPWRAYAAQHLWTSGTATAVVMPAARQHAVA
jgi:AraC family transcriptional regulator of adaptative response / DNA-3-methyladenine glycosylase II